VRVVIYRAAPPVCSSVFLSMYNTSISEWNGMERMKSCIRAAWNGAAWNGICGAIFYHDTQKVSLLVRVFFLIK